MKKYFILDLDFETNGFNKMTQETGGRHVLGSQYHALLEVGAILLDDNLETLGWTHEYIDDKERVNNWNEDTRKFHDKVFVEENGSFNDIWRDAEKVDLKSAEDSILNLLIRHFGGDLPDAHPTNDIQIILAARSVQFDMSFIDAQMPRLSKKLSHQAFDISTFRIAMRMWHPTIKDTRNGVVPHHALEDAEFARKELMVIRDFIDTMPDGKKYLEDTLEELEAPLKWSTIGSLILDKITSYFIH